MSEQNDFDNLDDIREKLERFKIKAEFAVQDIIHDTRFKTLVPANREKTTSLSAEAFAGEAMHFISKNLSKVLKPLNPTHEQISIFQHLLQSIDDGTLVLNKEKGKVDISNRPFIVKHYRTQDGDFIVNEARLTIRYGVEDPYPHGFTVVGSTSTSVQSSINFITFPKKPKSSTEVLKYLGDGLKKNVTSSVQVFNKGERLIFDRVGFYRDEEIAVTDQYYLIGPFFGEGTNREYWLYGSNGEDHSKITTTQRAGVRDFAKQRN